MALPGRLIRTPALDLGAVAKTVTADVIVAHLDNQLRVLWAATPPSALWTIGLVRPVHPRQRITYFSDSCNALRLSVDEWCSSPLSS